VLPTNVILNSGGVDFEAVSQRQRPRKLGNAGFGQVSLLSAAVALTPTGWIVHPALVATYKKYAHLTDPASALHEDVTLEAIFRLRAM
jgi:hypothetical protein